MIEGCKIMKSIDQVNRELLFTKSPCSRVREAREEDSLLTPLPLPAKEQAVLLVSG